MATKSPEKILVTPPPPPSAPVSAMIVPVARQFKVSPFKQLADILRLRFGATKLASNEYYAARIYRPELSPAEKKQFVGEVGNRALNAAMSPPEIARISNFLQDKVLYTELLNRLEIAATETQAVVSQTRSFGGLPTLRSATDIESFLLSHARYPLFGKPVEGSKSVGSALLTSIDKATKTITLGNDQTCRAADIAAEIIADYPRGFMFQTAVQQNFSLTRVIGPALGTVRVVTVVDDGQPRPLYAIWKIPSPTAMSDNFWQSGSMLAEVDAISGLVGRVRRGTGPAMETLDTHPVSDLPLSGLQLPCWQQVLDLTVTAHKVSPENGVLGWDIGLTDTGPVIVECNTNPFHTLYQLATGQGVLNPDFAPVFDKVKNRNRAILAHHKAKGGK